MFVAPCLLAVGAQVGRLLAGELAVTYGDLLTAVKGLAARKSVRLIAGDIHGADAVAVSVWDTDSDVRVLVRRLVKKARFVMKGRYLELATADGCVPACSGPWGRSTAFRSASIVPPTRAVPSRSFRARG